LEGFSSPDTDGKLTSNHATTYVKDVERGLRFYRDIRRQLRPHPAARAHARTNRIKAGSTIMPNEVVKLDPQDSVLIALGALRKGEQIAFASDSNV
jgi:hypothetical protein